MRNKGFNPPDTHKEDISVSQFNDVLKVFRQGR